MIPNTKYHEKRSQRCVKSLQNVQNVRNPPKCTKCGKPTKMYKMWKTHQNVQNVENPPRCANPQDVHCWPAHQSTCCSKKSPQMHLMRCGMEFFCGLSIFMFSESAYLVYLGLLTRSVFWCIITNLLTQCCSVFLKSLYVILMDHGFEFMAFSKLPPCFSHRHRFLWLFSKKWIETKIMWVLYFT